MTFYNKRHCDYYRMDEYLMLEVIGEIWVAKPTTDVGTKSPEQFKTPPLYICLSKGCLLNKLLQSASE